MWIKRKERFLFFVRKILAAAVITIVSLLISIFPAVGYYGEASISVLSSDPYGFLLVQTTYNMTYNPFLYCLSWLTGNGYCSNSFLFISKPTHYMTLVADPLTKSFSERTILREPPRTGVVKYNIAHRSEKDLEEEAILMVVLRQLYMNIPFNFIVFLAIGLANMQDYYLYLIVGIIGFSVGGFLGALVGFFAGLFTVWFVKSRLGIEECILVNFWNFIMEKTVEQGL